MTIITMQLDTASCAQLKDFLRSVPPAKQPNAQAWLERIKQAERVEAERQRQYQHATTAGNQWRWA